MEVFGFDRGEDVTVSLDGKILGGISRLVCSENTDYTKINEVFTDVPVEELGTVEHTLEFTLNFKNGNPFENMYFDRIEIMCGEKSCIYYKCRVIKTKKIINARGAIEGSVVLKAEEKEVI